MSAAATARSDMEHALHELSQPLATLQCRLEFAQMMGDDLAFRRAVEGALVDCAEIGERVTAMRGCLAKAIPRHAEAGR